MNEYPKEVQAVLDAAADMLAADPVPGRWTRLSDAVAAYRKSVAPPEPFEAYLGIYADGDWIVTPSRPGGPFETYRCTVTPTERVQ